MIADRLARYSHVLRYEHLSADVIHEVKRRVLDSLACAFGAWHAAPCRIARQMAHSVTVPQGATLWGTAHKTLPDLAAFANGTLVRYLDFNDTYLSKEPAHPSDNLAAIFAVGEMVRASGKRVIQAAALAYEVQCRLCDAAALRPRGWDHVTYGPFSSALAVAKVLKLSVGQTVQAINLAGVANVALRQTRVGDLSMWKACAFANAARNGLFAALLAKHGMTGPAPIFEGDKGFMALVSGSLDLPAFGGKRVPFKILDTYMKPYPAEYHALSAIEATVAVRAELLNKEGRAALTRIAEITVGSYDVAIEIIGRGQEKWRPSTRETADHSLPYCVGVAWLDGTVTVQSFEPRRLSDPTLRALMRKVRVIAQDEFLGWYPQAMPTRVTVRTTSGNEYVKQVDHPVGHPRNPLSDCDIEEKFRGLTAKMFDRARAGTIIDLVWRLDRLADIGVLMPLLSVRGRTRRA